MRCLFAEKRAGLAWPLLLMVMVLAGIPPAEASPGEGEAVLEISVDGDSVLFADPLVLTIDVLAPQTHRVEPPPAGQRLGPFEVRDIQFLPPGAAPPGTGEASSGEIPAGEPVSYTHLRAHET